MTETAGAGQRGERLAAISTGIVTLHKDYYGKGPTEAKTYAFDDSIVCVLKGGFTSVEHTLVARREVGRGRADPAAASRGR